MTCREKLMIEHPEQIDPNCYGGCNSCPIHYGYMKNPTYCKMDVKTCTECWNREIPEPCTEDHEPTLEDCCDDLVRCRARLMEGGYTSEQAFKIIIMILSM